MRVLILGFCLILSVAACKNGQKTAENETIPRSQEGTPGLDLSRDIRVIETDPANFVQLLPAEGAEGKDFSTGNVYLEKVERANRQGKFGLLLSGQLPDGCSVLHKAEVETDGSAAKLQLRSRKPVGAMCTQALVPFSYFVEIEDEAVFDQLDRWTTGEAEGSIE